MSNTKTIKMEDSIELKDFIQTAGKCDPDKESFDRNIQCLKEILEKMYDFEWLNQVAIELNYKRKQLFSFCEEYAQKYGDNIMDICSHKEVILTTPTKFGEYCPFPTEQKVIYSNKPQQVGDIVSVNNNSYQIRASRAETTPYYEIFCSLLEEANIRRY